MNLTDNDVLLNIENACTLLNVSRATIYRLLKDGAIPGHKIRGQWRFFPDELRQWAKLR